jgi:DNA-binding Xre family transcriptional regulator
MKIEPKGDLNHNTRVHDKVMKGTLCGLCLGSPATKDHNSTTGETCPVCKLKGLHGGDCPEPKKLGNAVVDLGVQKAAATKKQKEDEAAKAKGKAFAVIVQQDDADRVKKVRLDRLEMLCKKLEESDPEHITEHSKK